MNDSRPFINAIFAGWRAYQDTLVAALRPLNDDQLALRPAPQLRTVDTIARHIVGARARWFSMVLGEGGEEFKALARWDRRGARPRPAAELVDGVERTWAGMRDALAGWSADDWARTWPGQAGEPATLTTYWVIWHLIEHDLHHGGEISFALGMHGLPGIAL